MKKRMFLSSFIFLVVLSSMFSGFNIQNKPLNQVYSSIKNIDIGDGSYCKKVGPYTYTVDLSNEEINRITDILHSCENITLLKREMPSYSVWINLKLKSGKNLKLIYFLNSLIFSENNTIYKIKPDCADFMTELYHKYVELPPDEFDLSYTSDLFKNYGINLTPIQDTSLTLNKIKGKSFLCNNEMGLRIGIYTFTSAKEMTKGLKDWESFSKKLGESYSRIYSAGNVIITVFGSTKDNFYTDKIATITDFMKRKPEHLFPIDTYKIYESTSKLQFTSDGSSDESIYTTTYESSQIKSILYPVKYNQTTDIIVPKNQEVMLTFYNNYDSTANWELTNYVQNNIIQFDKQNRVYNSQNFFFKGLKEGNMKITLKLQYKSSSAPNNVSLNFIVK